MIRAGINIIKAIVRLSREICVKIRQTTAITLLGEKFLVLLICYRSFTELEENLLD
jgi:hypothetical protein